MERSAVFCSVLSGSVLGLEVNIIKVEIDVSYGIPCFEMSGILSTEVKEARERVRIAIRNSGITIKPMKIAVNLSPASVRKQGTGFDVPIAVGILAALELVSRRLLKDTFIMGELSLSGKVHRVNGVLPALCEARKQGMKRCIIPEENLSEAFLIEGMEIYGAGSLSQVIKILNGQGKPAGVERDLPKRQGETPVFEELYGQAAAKRATMVAVAGMHNILYMGSPGCGKTMLAQRIPGIMPDMTFEEQLEVSKIYSVAGLLKAENGWMSHRPFRSPHHTVTGAALIGGGNIPGPGEITLAHGGVLFLDELTEYHMMTLEHLRQPLEEKKITLTRVHGTYTFPADFMLAAAMNPCKCGYYPDKSKCHCTDYEIRRYMGKISRPLWDRFDIVVETQDVEAGEIFSGHRVHTAYTTEKMKQKIEAAAAVQKERFKGKPFGANAMMNVEAVKKYCVLAHEGEELLKEIYEKMSLTVRGCYKILKTARTIADLEEQEYIDCMHLSEAVSYRNERKQAGQ